MWGALVGAEDPLKTARPGLETSTEQNEGLTWRRPVLYVRGCHRLQSLVTLGCGDRKTSLWDRKSRSPMGSPHLSSALTEMRPP